jgi:hypothetical protein
MISRVRLGDVFFGVGREGVVKVSRRGGTVSASKAGGVTTQAGTGISSLIDRFGASEDGVSLDDARGFNGVRKGDLKGLWSVFLASFNRRRLACGVDMISELHPLTAVTEMQITGCDAYAWRERWDIESEAVATHHRGSRCATRHAESPDCDFPM